MHSRKALIKKLIKHRNGPDSNEIKKTRKRNIRDIKTTLDYPEFKKIDVEEFFKIWDESLEITNCVCTYDGKIFAKNISSKKELFLKVMCNPCNLPIFELVNKALYCCL